MYKGTALGHARSARGLDNYTTRDARSTRATRATRELYDFLTRAANML